MNNFFGINHIAKLINRLLLLMSSSDIDPIYTSYCRKCKEEYGIIRPHIRKTGRPYQFKHHVHKDLESIIENKPSNPDLNTLISSSYLFCDTCWKWILKKMKGLPLELVPVPPLSCDVCGIDDCLGIYTIPLWRGKYVRSGFYSLCLCRHCYSIGKRIGALPFAAYLYCGDGYGFNDYIWHVNAKTAIRVESRYRRKVTLLTVFTAAKKYQQGITHEYKIPFDVLKLIVVLA